MTKQLWEKLEGILCDSLLEGSFIANNNILDCLVSIRDNQEISSIQEGDFLYFPLESYPDENVLIDLKDRELYKLSNSYAIRLDLEKGDYDYPLPKYIELILQDDPYVWFKEAIVPLKDKEIDVLSCKIQESAPKVHNLISQKYAVLDSQRRDEATREETEMICLGLL